jgi:hypothetical protein
VKYLVVTIPGDHELKSTAKFREAIEEQIPGVKVVLIFGATSATLVDVASVKHVPQPSPRPVSSW